MGTNLLLQKNNIYFIYQKNDSSVNINENVINSEVKNDDNYENKASEDFTKCNKCGIVYSVNVGECPNCNEKFETEVNNKDLEKSSMDEKYNDLTNLKKLLDKKIITKEEFDKEKKKVLKD